MNRCYFVVEGPHEIEVIGHLLRRRGLHRVRLLDDLDEQFQALVPTTYPVDGDILRRVATPTFFQNESHCVAIDSAIGVERLCTTFQVRRTRVTELHGVGILADADQNAAGRRQEIVSGLPELDFGSEAGGVYGDTPRAGIYVLPDNENPGSLEDLLLRCAEVVYPTLLKGARDFVSPLDAKNRSVFVDRKESEDLRKPFGKDKAIIACVANVLRPGKAIQVSIQDNRWFKDDRVFQEPLLKNLEAFVDAVLGLNPTADSSHA